LKYKWSDNIPNSNLYNGLEFVSIRLRFAGHCIRSKEPTSNLLLWDHTKLVNSKECFKGASNASSQLLKAIGRVDGPVTSDEEVSKLIMDREAWRSRIKMIEAKNKEV
jgi:hypothetical protein